MDKEQLIKGFDIQAYLNAIGMPYREAGAENVGTGWIGLNCVFCLDDKAHLGIHLNTKRMNCWLCGGKTIISFIETTEATDRQGAYKILKAYQVRFTFEREPKKKRRKKHTAQLPIGFKLLTPNNVPTLVKQFIRKRAFPMEICFKNKVGYCLPGGEHPFHLIVPVYEKNRVVSYIACDMTGEAENKYKMASNDKALVEKGECVYGLNTWHGDRIIFVEGVFDKWRIGNKAVALLTKNWTRAQLLKIRSKTGDVPAFIALDKDARKEAFAREYKTLARELHLIYTRVFTVELETAKDPDVLSFKALHELRTYPTN